MRAGAWLPLLALAVVACSAVCPALRVSAGPSQPVQPALSIGVSPVMAAFDLRAGDTTTFEALFSSGGTQSFEARVDLYDALRRGVGGFHFVEPGQEFWSAGNWLTADTLTFPMAPNQRREVTLTLTVPPDTPDGEYYAAFGATVTPDTVAGPSSVSVQVKGSVISLICVAIGEGLERSAQLVPYGEIPLATSPSAPSTARLLDRLGHWWLSLVIGDRNVAQLAEGQVFRVFAPLENTCEVHIQPRVTATFLRRGAVVGRAVVAGQIILPGDKMLVEVPWVDAPFYGRYRVELAVEYGGVEPIEVSRDFLIVPIKGILGLVTLAFGLGYLLARRGRGRTTTTPPSQGRPA